METQETWTEYDSIGGGQREVAPDVWAVWQDGHFGWYGEAHAFIPDQDEPEGRTELRLQWPRRTFPGRTDAREYAMAQAKRLVPHVERLAATP